MLPAATITIAVAVTVRDLRGLAAVLVLRDPEVVPVLLVRWDLRVNPDFRVTRVLLGLPDLSDLQELPDQLALPEPPDLPELLELPDPLELLDLLDPLELLDLLDPPELMVLPELPDPPDLPAL